MPASFTHDEEMSRNMGRVLKPFMVLDMVAVVVIMSRVLVWEDPSSVWAWAGAIAFVVLIGLIIPVMLLVMRVRIHVDDRLYSLRLWPFPFRSNVPRRAIKAAYVREVKPVEGSTAAGASERSGATSSTPSAVGRRSPSSSAARARPAS